MRRMKAALTAALLGVSSLGLLIAPTAALARHGGILDFGSGGGGNHFGGGGGGFSAPHIFNPSPGPSYSAPHMNNFNTRAIQQPQYLQVPQTGSGNWADRGRHHHHRNFDFGFGLVTPYYSAPDSTYTYADSCAWLRVKYEQTGSNYWLRRLRDCEAGYTSY